MMYKKMMVCLLFMQQISYAMEGQQPEIDAFEMVPHTAGQGQGVNPDFQAHVSVYDAYRSGQMGMMEALHSMVSSSATTVVSSAHSAYTSTSNTLRNALDDKAALAKLGYPPCPVNDAELAKFVAIKERYVQNIRAYNKNDDFKSDNAFIGRRIGYLQRAINLVDTRSDGMDLAFFCLHNYQPIMTFCDMALLCKFIQLKQVALEKGVGLLNNSNNVNNTNNQAVQVVAPQNGQQQQEVPVMPVESQILQSLMQGFGMSSIIGQVGGQPSVEQKKEEDDISTDDEANMELAQLEAIHKNANDLDAH